MAAPAGAAVRGAFWRDRLFAVVAGGFATAVGGGPVVVGEGLAAAAAVGAEGLAAAVAAVWGRVVADENQVVEVWGLVVVVEEADLVVVVVVEV